MIIINIEQEKLNIMQVEPNFFYNAQQIPENFLTIDDTYHFGSVWSNKDNYSGKVFIVTKGDQYFAAKFIKNGKEYDKEMEFYQTNYQSEYLIGLEYHSRSAKVTLIDEQSNTQTINIAVIILEFCEHGQIFDFIVNFSELNRKYQDNRLLPFGVALGLFKHIIKGIKYLHQTKRILHRDIKPSNILLDKDFKIKIIDFGLATKIQNTMLTNKDAPGTLSYMAPQIKQNKQIRYCGPESDIFSSGVIFYNLCFLASPFGTQDDVKKTYNQKYEKFGDPNKQYQLPTVWRSIQKRYHTQIPNEIKQFFTRIFLRDYSLRPTINQILALPMLDINKIANDQQIKKQLSQQFSRHLQFRNDHIYHRFLKIKQALQSDSRGQDDQTFSKLFQYVRQYQQFYEEKQITSSSLSKTFTTYNKLAFSSDIYFIQAWLIFELENDIENKETVMGLQIKSAKLLPKQNGFSIEVKLISNQIQDQQKEQKEEIKEEQQILRIQGIFRYRDKDGKVVIQFAKTKQQNLYLRALLKNIGYKLQALKKYEEEKAKEDKEKQEQNMQKKQQQNE